MASDLSALARFQSPDPKKPSVWTQEKIKTKPLALALQDVEANKKALGAAFEEELREQYHDSERLRLLGKPHAFQKIRKAEDFDAFFRSADSGSARTFVSGLINHRVNN